MSAREATAGFAHPDEKGRMPIAKPIREAFGLRAGSTVAWVKVGTGLGCPDPGGEPVPLSSTVRTPEQTADVARHTARERYRGAGAGQPGFEPGTF